MAVALYGLGPLQLRGRLVLGWYRHQSSTGQSLGPATASTQVPADQTLGSATVLSPRTMLSVFDNRYNRLLQMLNHWPGLWRDPCWLGFKII